MRTNIPIQAVADYTILVLYSRGIPVSPLKLQKILYYIQAWHMVYFGRDNLVFDEVPEAWINGPVYRSVYNTYKNMGIYDNIKPAINPNDTIEKNISDVYYSLGIDKNQEEFLEFMFMNYGTMDDGKLVFLTHSEKPWSEKREGLSPFDYSEEKIDLDTMFEYYHTRMERNRTKNGSNGIS